MAWYYAQGGQRFGPVADEAFSDLVRQGQVTAATLVWQTGMANWMPYHQLLSQAVAPSPDGAAGAGTAQATGFCSQCGRYFSTQDMVEYQGRWVCADCKTTFFQRIHEGAVAPVGYGQAVAISRYAGFWIRFAAYLIDAVLLSIVNFAIGFVFGTAMVGMSSSRHGDATGIMALQLVSNLIAIGVGVTYEALMLGKYGATLGKMACGVKVVRANGQPIGYGLAVGRYFSKILSSCTLAIGFIIAGFDDQKRALHDHICGTRVVYK